MSSKSQPPQRAQTDKKPTKAKANFNKAPNAGKGYKLLKHLPDDARFGDIHLIKHPKDGKTLFIKEKTVNTEKEATRDITVVQDRILLNHPHIQVLEDWASVTEENWCSTFYQVR